MTTQNTHAVPRPLAAVMAFIVMTTLWLPTVASPAHAAWSGSALAQQGPAASGVHAPALM